MTIDIDVKSIFFEGDDAAEERLVEHYFNMLREGKPVAMPLLVQKADGRYTPLDQHDRAKVVAAKRCGEETIPAYVIQDPGPEQLEKVRREREAGRVSSN